jgi:hypothetical protein
MDIKRTERGWAGHFICANRCRFRRNTLLHHNDIEIVVSTVGLMEFSGKNGFETVGNQRYYETMAFHTDPEDVRYHDINVNRQVYFESPWYISEIDADDKANDMHEAVVTEILEGLVSGNKYETEEVETA